MSGFRSLPPESILLIFESCDGLSQAIALASTSKQLYSIFSSSVHSIGTRIGRREILAFDDAVTAARATRLVLEHFHKGELPPAQFPLDSLGLKAQKLCLKDLSLILDWAHLVNCVENICVNNSNWGQHFRLYLSKLYPTAPHDWRERFHRSMYRVFLAGAALCGIYQAPLSIEPPYGFLDRYGCRPLRDDEIVHMLSYHVFNFEDYHSHFPIYSQLARYFAEQSPDRAQRETPPNVYPDNATPNMLSRDQANTLYVDVLQCLFAYMLMSNNWNETALFKSHEHVANGETTMWTRKVTILPLDKFYPEEVSMPADSQAAHDTLLLKSPVNGKTANGPYSPFLDQILWDLYSASGQPNHYGDDMPTPPPPLQIFQFISRRYLGLRFANNAFEQMDSDSAYSLFLYRVESGDIYLEGKGAPWPEGAWLILDDEDGDGDYEPYFRP